MLQPGDPAPEFELPNADLEITNSSDFKGRSHLIIYFYPKDDTPGCTMEAIEFSDLLDDFSAAGAEVIGVSMDNCLSHGEFRDKHGLAIRLLADVEGELCRAYDVLREKEAHGERQLGILRSTFIIDRKGIIRYTLYDVKPKHHVAEVLKLVQNL